MLVQYIHIMCLYFKFIFFLLLLTFSEGIKANKRKFYFYFKLPPVSSEVFTLGDLEG